jgi:hypothetical protein
MVLRAYARAETHGGHDELRAPSGDQVQGELRGKNSPTDTETGCSGAALILQS